MSSEENAIIAMLMSRIDHICAKTGAIPGMIFEWASRHAKKHGIAYSESLRFAAEELEAGRLLSELTVVDPPEKPQGLQKGGKPSTPNPFCEKPRQDGPFISFPLSNDNLMELRLAARVSKKDFERLKKLIELSEDSLVEEDAE